MSLHEYIWEYESSLKRRQERGGEAKDLNVSLHFKEFNSEYIDKLMAHLSRAVTKVSCW